MLKGALLFTLWTGQPHRETWDVDLLGWGEPVVERLVGVFREICRVAVEEDGLHFDEARLHGEPIRENQIYGGIRLTLEARLEAARIPIQVDVGFGDVIATGPEEIEFPTPLSLPAPHVKGYPRETVVAEKFEAIVSLGMTNSRMKDFYDISLLARNFAFDGPSLCKAIAATCKRRGTEIPKETPLALTASFWDNLQKRTQWEAFLRKGGLSDSSRSLREVVEFVRDFVLSAPVAVANGERFGMQWSGGGPWRTTEKDQGVEPAVLRVSIDLILLTGEMFSE